MSPNARELELLQREQVKERAWLATIEAAIEQLRHADHMLSDAHAMQATLFEKIAELEELRRQEKEQLILKIARLQAENQQLRAINTVRGLGGVLGGI
jgi:hypothetical protein